MVPSRRGGLRRWFLAVTGALFLNALVFGLMPNLTDRLPVKKEEVITLPGVKIVRIKRRDPEKPRRPNLNRPVNVQTRPHVIKKRVFGREIKTMNYKSDFELNFVPPSPPGLTGFNPAALPVSALPVESTYGIGEIDGGLTPIVKIPPRYPLWARRRNIEGWVKVRFVVDEQGRVESIDIIAAEPKDVFEQSVLDSITSWRFLPGKIEGVAVKTRVETTIRFELR